jgi:hypothetical protein
MAAADALLCPHIVDEFTLSLDAIKSFEYVASGRAVVATPTSGFQCLPYHEGVHVVMPAGYVDRLELVLSGSSQHTAPRGTEYDWSDRARSFAAALKSAMDRDRLDLPS